MKLCIPLILALAGYAAATGAATLDELKQRAEIVAKSGAAAAGFTDIAKGRVDDAEVDSRFAGFGDDVVKAAHQRGER